MSQVERKAGLLSGHTREEIDHWVAKFPPGRQRSAVLSALRAAQEQNHGFLSLELMDAVADYLQLPPIQIYEVASFYSMFETRPCGRHHVSVCTNISCSLRGADALYEAIRAAAGEAPELNVRSFECLGACDIAPMASIDGVYVGPLTTDDVPQLLKDIRAGQDVLPEKQLARRPCADPKAIG